MVNIFFCKLKRRTFSALLGKCKNCFFDTLLAVCQDFQKEGSVADKDISILVVVTWLVAIVVAAMVL